MNIFSFKYNDGGRNEYFDEKASGGCSIRALSIATQNDYKKVYNILSELMKQSILCKKERPDNGIRANTYLRYLLRIPHEDRSYLDFKYNDEGKIIDFDKYPFELNDIPKQGRFLIYLHLGSKTVLEDGYFIKKRIGHAHFSSIINGCIHDTFDYREDDLEIYSWIRFSEKQVDLPFPTKNK